MNKGFAALTFLLEKQATRLERQARRRSEARAKAADMARRAQLAQMEARQAQQAVILSEDESSVGSHPLGNRGGGMSSGIASSSSLLPGGTSKTTTSGNDASGQGRGGEGGSVLNAGDTDRGGGGNGKFGNMSRAADAAAKAVEAAVAATAAADVASAAAANVAAQAEHWHGSESLAVLLGAISDCLVDEPTAAQIAARMCKAVMTQVRVLSEEELKKENQDVSLTPATDSASGLRCSTRNLSISQCRCWNNREIVETGILRFVRQHEANPPHFWRCMASRGSTYLPSCPYFSDPMLHAWFGTH